MLLPLHIPSVRYLTSKVYPVKQAHVFGVFCVSCSQIISFLFIWYRGFTLKDMGKISNSKTTTKHMKSRNICAFPIVYAVCSMLVDVTYEKTTSKNNPKIGSIFPPPFWYRIPITDNFIIIMCDLNAKITLSSVNHIQLHIGFHLVYAVLWTFMVVVPLVTKPRDSGMGLLIILVTGIPYYLIFVKGNAMLRFLEGINRECPENRIITLK